jgi:ATP-dependent DNA ligase
MNDPVPVKRSRRRPAPQRDLCQLVVDWTGRMPEGGAIVEPKLDGIRMLWIDGDLVTRDGAAIRGAAHIAARLRQLERQECVPMFFDGEWIVDGSYDATLAHYAAGGANGDAGHFYVFDALPMRVWRGEDPGLALKDRRPRVERLVSGEESHQPGVHAMPWSWCATAAEIEDKARALIAGGAEGVVVKSPLATYRRTRTGEWQRIKQAVSMEATILDVEPQPECAWKLGALVIMLDGRRARVSTGFSDTQRMALWHDRAQLVGAVAEFVMDRAADGNLRAPRFLRLRFDKEEGA